MEIKYLGLIIAVTLATQLTRIIPFYISFDLSTKISRNIMFKLIVPIIFLFFISESFILSEEKVIFCISIVVTILFYLKNRSTGRAMLLGSFIYIGALNL